MPINTFQLLDLPGNQRIHTMFMSFRKKMLMIIWNLHYIKNFAIDTTGSKLNWASIRQIKVTKKEKDAILIKLKHDDADYRRVEVFQKHRGQKPSMTLCNAYSVLLDLPKAKYDDLDALCKAGANPYHYHQYYKDLPHAEGDIWKGYCGIFKFESIENGNRSDGKAYNECIIVMNKVWAAINF